MYKFRLRFSKTGSLRFIGHLDFLRIFQQMIRRAGLPIAYSKGFNPHQQLSFALPLPLGMTSINDYADITLATGIPPLEIVKTLNVAAPQGLHIHAAKPINQGEGAAAAIVITAMYFIRTDNLCQEKADASLPEGSVSTQRRASEMLYPTEQRGLELSPIIIEEILSSPTLVVLKKTKSGVKNTDIRPDIKKIVATSTGVELLLSAGSSQFLNPLLVAEVIFGKKPCTSTITRVELYRADGMPL